jgi:hypothetical protein
VTGWGLDTLFNPSKRHMDEEKQRLQSTREEVGDNSGGERIDLTTGKVVIKRKADDEVISDVSGAEAASTQDTPAPDEVSSDTPAGRARLRRAALRRKADRDGRA